MGALPDGVFDGEAPQTGGGSSVPDRPVARTAGNLGRSHHSYGPPDESHRGISPGDVYARRGSVRTIYEGGRARGAGASEAVGAAPRHPRPGPTRLHLHRVDVPPGIDELGWPFTKKRFLAAVHRGGEGSGRRGAFADLEGK